MNLTYMDSTTVWVNNTAASAVAIGNDSHTKELRIRRGLSILPVKVKCTVLNSSFFSYLYASEY